MSEYHKSNIRNSINPSILIQFYEKPGSDEEKQMIVRELNNSFAGARKTGRSMITFSDGKDLSPTVTQMEANKLDKTFLSLTDTIQRQICYSHQIDPMLLGLKTPGSLGNSGEFLYSFNLFNASQIQPAQRQIENILNKFIQVNGLGVTIELNEPSIDKYQPITTP
jgi:phage portal protein BeeE